MSSPSFLPAHELAQGLRRGLWSSQELTEHYIERIQRLDATTNAVVVRDFDRAVEQARRADAARARGEPGGPLAGVPITVKEAFDVAGLPTTWGFEQHRGNVAHTHAVAVARLVDAGAIVLGKTNVPVALADWQTFNPVYGTTRNPWDPARTPGGSSGGSAAALAAGLSALELGSDIGASIRNPAHYCGVYGHKPTWGVVPMGGHALPNDPFPDTLDIAAVGPMARSARDLELALDLVSAPLAAFGPLGWLPAQWRDPGTPVPRLRVAVVADAPCAEVDRCIREGLKDLAAFLRDAGLTVSEAAQPVDPLEAWEVYVHLLRSATGSQLDDASYALARQHAASGKAPAGSYEAWHWAGNTLSHRDWVHFDRRRSHLRQQWATFFQEWDLLICPVACSPAFTHNQTGQRWERMIPVNGQPQPTTQSLFWAGYPGVVGLPATAVPLAQSPDGLPVGAQIIGPVMADPMCLRLARFLEAHWRGFAPPPGFD